MVMQQGDIFYVNYDPSIGHEQKRYRPAIVLSHDLVQSSSQMWICAPISTTKRKHPAYHELKSTKYIHGKVLLDQVKSLDLIARAINKDSFIERIDKNEFIDIINRFKLLFDVE